MGEALSRISHLVLRGKLLPVQLLARLDPVELLFGHAAVVLARATTREELTGAGLGARLLGLVLAASTERTA